MLRIILWLLAAHAIRAQVDEAAGEQDADMLVSRLTVSELRELILQTLSEALPLHNNCTDYSEEGDCPLVVENNLCNTEEYYARYCCRSCTLAKQIPTYGTHLSLTAEAPILATIITEKTNYPRGSNVNLSCEATGFPAPEIVWFKNYLEISSPRVYDQYVEVTGGVMVKTIRSDILIKNYSMDGDYSHYECMAINSAGYDKKSIILNIEDEVSMTVLPEVPLFTVDDDIRLECIVRGIGLGKVSWYREDELLRDSRKYRIRETRSISAGVTTVVSRFHILRDKTYDSGRLFTCSVNDRSGIVKEVWTDLVVSDINVNSKCNDLAGTKACFEDSRLCRQAQPYVQRYCCRTCTLVGALPPRGPHLESKAEAPLEMKFSQRHGLPYGESMRLACLTTGYPEKQEIIWSKDEEMIVESERYHIEEKAECSPLTCEVNSYLTIKDVRVEDGGWYKCVARNPVTVNHLIGLLSFTESGKVDFLSHTN